MLPRVLLPDEEAIVVEDPGINIGSTAIEHAKPTLRIPSSCNDRGIAAGQRNISFPVVICSGDSDRIAVLLQIGESCFGSTSTRTLAVAATTS